MNLQRLFPIGVLPVLVASLVCTTAVAVSDAALTRSEADATLSALWQETKAQLQTNSVDELQTRTISRSGKTLRWEERVFGTPGTNGHSLWISMHGGGNAPARVNDSQWRNQINLYKPEEGIYIAPRAPTDTWNLWHESHIDDLFDALIQIYTAARNVDPDRVYLMGYSAGGDGVWQLAPRMADRLAAAAMMAGHPNDASLISLRNLPFAMFVGGADAAYNRNTVVAAKAKEMSALQAKDPDGYIHMARIYPGLPHWMQKQDAEALPWMLKYTRDPWPKKVVWRQSGREHTRFYWLSVPKTAFKPGDTMFASVNGQEIQLLGNIPETVTLRLSDNLLNLDKPVRVVVEGREVFSGSVARRERFLRQSLQERADPRSAASTYLTVSGSTTPSAP